MNARNEGTPVSMQHEKPMYLRTVSGQQAQLVSGRRFLLAIVLILFLTGGGGILTFLIVRMINPAWIATVDFVVLLVAEGYGFILVALLLAFGGWGGVRERLALRYTSGRDLLLALGVLVLTRGVLILIYLLLSPIVGPLPSTLLQELRHFTDLSRLSSADALSMSLIVVRACLLAPLGEELLFRGALFGWLRRRLSAKYTILSTALLFALTALSVLFALAIFVDGLAIGWVRERTGSTLNVAVMHVLNNTLMLGIASMLVAQHLVT
jgi:membrane protease YdiL (CAAX protease family)